MLGYCKTKSVQTRTNSQQQNRTDV